MGFEHMRVYQAARELDKRVIALLEGVARGHAHDADHARRSSGSVGNNIAEAFGSEQPGRKISFLEIARASADETRATLLRLTDRGALDPRDIYTAAALTRVIAKMLTAWIKTIQGRQ